MREQKTAILINLLGAYKIAHIGRPLLGAQLADQILSTLHRLYASDPDFQLAKEIDAIKLNRVFPQSVLLVQPVASPVPTTLADTKKMKVASSGVQYGKSSLSAEHFAQAKKKLTPTKGVAYAKAATVVADDKATATAPVPAEDGTEEIKAELETIMGILEQDNDNLILRHSNSYTALRKYIKQVFKIDISEKEDQGMVELRQGLSNRGEELNKKLNATG